MSQYSPLSRREETFIFKTEPKTEQKVNQNRETDRTGTFLFGDWRMESQTNSQVMNPDSSNMELGF